MMLGGCRALRGPEPFGQTFVAPPGPIAPGGVVRTVPPIQPRHCPPYGPVQPQYVQPEYAQPQYPPLGSAPPQYAQPQYLQPGATPSPAPQYSPGTPVPAAPGQMQYPDIQSQYLPKTPTPSLPHTPTPQLPSTPTPQFPNAPTPLASQVTLRITGPTRAIVGVPASYRFDVANASAISAPNVTITCQLPEGWTYVSSDVAGAVSGQKVEWRLGNVPAYRTMAINANFRADALGVANLCADIASATGAATRSCTTTSVEAATPSVPGTDLPPAAAGSSLHVAISGPDRAAPGDSVSYNVTVTNRGSARATKLLVTDDFSDGFVHEAAKSPIEKDLEDLEPGQKVMFKITFRVARPGRHCHVVQVTGEGGLKATAEACVVAAGSPKVSVRQTATPTTIKVGGTVRFAIDIKNEGDVDLTGLVVALNFDRALHPTRATEIRGREALANLKDDRYELTPYRFDRLEPGKSIQLDVECKAEDVSPRACGRVTVTAQEGVREEALTCLKIEAGP
jgi:uncharacterized repeat protein (TIGR01451 family)